MVGFSRKGEGYLCDLPRKGGGDFWGIMLSLVLLCRPGPDPGPICRVLQIVILSRQVKNLFLFDVHMRPLDSSSLKLLRHNV